MTFLDRFTRKTRSVPAAALRPTSPVAAKPSPPAAAKPSLPKNENRRIVGVLIAPRSTEKSNAAGRDGWYTFQVRPDASKVLIRQAVTDRYGVAVERVRIVRIPPRPMRLGRIAGEVPGFKKAMVKVRLGQSIELE